jgi:hypothetical protein
VPDREPVLPSRNSDAWRLPDGRTLAQITAADTALTAMLGAG